jgi:hypothetical protein
MRLSLRKVRQQKVKAQQWLSVQTSDFHTDYIMDPGPDFVVRPPASTAKAGSLTANKKVFPFFGSDRTAGLLKEQWPRADIWNLPANKHEAEVRSFWQSGGKLLKVEDVPQEGQVIPNLPAGTGNSLMQDPESTHCQTC